MKGESLRVCPASELAGFGAKDVRYGGVGVHEPGSDDKEKCETEPSNLLQSPEHIGVDDALEPEVLCVEVCQRKKAADRDKRAQHPE